MYRQDSAESNTRCMPRACVTILRARTQQKPFPVAGMITYNLIIRRQSCSCHWRQFGHRGGDLPRASPQGRTCLPMRQGPSAGREGHQ